MSELFNIEKIMVGAEKLTARIAVNEGLPTMTSEDIEATARVYYLAPEIAHHLCLGDAGREFQDCMHETEVAHLLEHLSVEIMRETGLAGDISCGRTRRVSGEDRTFEVELSCPDDTLTIGALSSATFMMDWAFLHGNAPAPDFPGTVARFAIWFLLCVASSRMHLRQRTKARSLRLSIPRELRRTPPLHMWTPCLAGLLPRDLAPRMRMWTQRLSARRR